MNRRICLPIMTLLIGAFVFFGPGCDELVTEITEVTIAGHPTAEFSVDIDSGCAPLEVQFTDLSQGPHDSLFWYFGDDSSLVGDTTDTTAINPKHTYNTAGTYDVTLTIRNSTDGGEDTEFKKRCIVVGTTVADFSADTTIGCPGMEVTFTPTEYGGVTSWQWNFGDGSPVSIDSNPTHPYDSVGVYSVTLTVTGGCGTKVIGHDSLIEIGDCPTVAFHVDTAEGYTSVGCCPLEVKFEDASDLSDEGFVSRLWDFGNDDTSSLPEPVVTYADPGVYTVSLTLTSTGGTSSDSIANYVTVYDSVRAFVSAVSDTEECFSGSFQFQVKFQADSLGTVDSLVWYFGDGTRSDDPLDTMPVHAYMTPGKYTVVLWSYGPCGDSSVDTAADFVILSNTLTSDSIGFTISPATGDTSTTFTFTDTSTGVILSRQWVIDTITVDNAPPEVLQKFSDPGWYHITLTVSNACGSVAVSDSVHVIEP